MNNDFSNLTLLYVEDDDIIRQNAVEYLSESFKEVFQAIDGQEALELYEMHKPDIIMSDIEMPRLSGLEMAKKIRKQDKTIPIIITTAFTDTEYMLQAIELQLIKYIVKPINTKKLSNALNLLMEHLNMNNIVTVDKKKYYDTLNKCFMVNNNIVTLTKKELQLLDLLAKNHHRVVTYEEIESHIWYDDYMSMDALRALVRTLRKKLQGEYIDNVSGFGYRLNVS
ncbi:MAG TPA: response regulator transcription factor [Epsilonproteobacteria bacterium]|nr:response regulator transcription factor [Campylobacterota bacterium]